MIFIMKSDCSALSICLQFVDAAGCTCSLMFKGFYATPVTVCSSVNSF